MEKTDEQPKEVGGEAREQARKPYAKPVLETYGAVSELTKGGAGSLGDGPMSTKMSDARAKQDVVRLGSHPLGVGIYAYTYRPEFRDRWGHGVQLGVIAQEVEAVAPEAISIDEGGYRRVDYAALARRAA